MASSQATPSTNKPAYLKGVLWFLFSGTAMLCAFVLPGFIAALLYTKEMPTAELIHPLITSIYFSVIILAAAYHGLYRVKTIVFDLGFHKIQKAVDVLCILLFFFCLAATAYVFFIR